MPEEQRAERAILDRAEVYRLVEEARQMRVERDAALAREAHLREAADRMAEAIEEGLGYVPMMTAAEAYRAAAAILGATGRD